MDTSWPGFLPAAFCMNLHPSSLPEEGKCEAELAGTSGASLLRGCFVSTLDPIPGSDPWHNSEGSTQWRLESQVGGERGPCAGTVAGPLTAGEEPGLPKTVLMGPHGPFHSCRLRQCHLVRSLILA